MSSECGYASCGLSADCYEPLFLLGRSIVTVDLECNGIGAEGGKSLGDGLGANSVGIMSLEPVVFHTAIC